MARGLFSGILVGAVVAGLGLAGLSVAYRDVGPISAPAPVATTSGPVGGPSGSEEAAPEAPEMQAPASVATPAPASPETAPASEAPPQAAAASPMPEVGVEAAQVPPGATSEAAPELNRGAAAPESAAPVAVPAPEAPSAEAQPLAEVRPTNPEVQAELALASEAPAPGQGPAPIAGEHEGAPMPAAPANVLPGAPETPVAPAQGPAQAAPVPPARLLPGGGAAIPGAEAGQIGDIAENVVTGRLPSIGGAPAQMGEAQAAPLPAIERNRAAFDYNGELPLMAVVLLDVGSERADLGDLKNLPFAISFAVDVAAPDAEEAVAFYRNAGAEVVLVLALPVGATPSDVETTFAAYQDLLGQSVAVMMARESGFQTLGDAARQVAQIVAAQGLGLITFPQGLNTGHKMALREGVAAGLIFRELDNDGQTSAVMRRFLDNAAFKARQNKGVIMLGHARAQTIQALIEWSLGSRAKTVTLAPVSVVLQDR